jgi:hypothetical protein
MSPDAAARCWFSTNEGISEFVQSHDVPCYTVFYDDLAVRPQQYFPPLSTFIGSRFESRVLEYWNYEHHGLGGNGAAFNVLGQYEHAQVTTGDDAFYRAHAGKHFHDTRWRAQLSPQERDAFEQSAAIRFLLAKHGRSFLHFDALAAESAGERTINSPEQPAAGILGRCGGMISRLASLCHL